MTPYRYPCFTTSPTTLNQVAELRRPVFPPGRTPRHTPNVVPPLAGTWARAHGAVPAPLPLAGHVGPLARMAARAPPWLGRNPPPPGPANRESFPFFLFSFSFPYFLIYVYILIYYAPKIVQIFSRSQNNNTYTLTHLIRQQCLMYCLLPVSARRRGIRPSGRRARARPPGNRSFVSRELRRR
jgi:hypothetical protein